MRPQRVRVAVAFATLLSLGDNDMFRGVFVKSLLALCLFCFAAAAQAATVDLIPVGNPGNPADTAAHSGNAAGQGSVSYAYKIGKFEITAGQYCEFLNAVADTDTYELYDTLMDVSNGVHQGCNIKRTGTSSKYAYSVASDWANRPVNYVSWGDAVRLANWLHNGQPNGQQGLLTTEDGSYYLNGAMTKAQLLAVTRKADATWVLPTEDEWYKAAYHKNDGVTGNYWNWPTCSDTDPSNALVHPDPGNTGTFWDCDTNTIGSPYWRTEVGAHENSASPYGTFDQGGNVTEWNESIVEINPAWGPWRGIRGGLYANSCYSGEPWYDEMASSRSSNDPTYGGNQRGFRLAFVSVPEPGSLVMLLGITLPSLLCWWQRSKRWAAEKGTGCGKRHHCLGKNR
jgi:formylglycine-generating enzyme